MRVTRSIIPNLFTVANLFCGFAAILASTERRVMVATMYIIGAAIFDMLDGVVARLTNSTSEFGVELDSLCDAVSFGVAPSVLLYYTGFNEWPRWGMLIASLPAIAGVLRLARFNVQLTSMEDKLYFRGMPIPAGAITILSYVAFWHGFTGADPFMDLGLHVSRSAHVYLLLAVTVITSGAMVSTIKYDNLPRPSMRSIRQRPVVFLVFLLGIIASVATMGLALFPFMLLYMIGGAIRHLVLFMRTHADDDDDTVEQPDPDPYQF